jgi:colanic acid biosynthesis glycosyl transferase WcaI
MGRLRMHVVLLNQPFHPDVVATAQMGKDLADALIARGHSVSAVCSRSIYGQAGAQLPKYEMIDGIEIHRVGASIFGRKGLIARAADFGLFYLLATLKLLTMKKPDVVVGFTTPPFIALLGLVCRIFRGSKAVYWLMDLYPDVPVQSGVFPATSPITRVCEWFSRLILKQSDATVVLGRCMQDRVLAKGAPADRVHFIPVWAGEDAVQPVEHADNPYRAQWNPDNRFVVMYSGNFGIAHDSKAILDAIVEVTRPNEPHPIRFIFVGSGNRKKEVLELISRHELGASVAWYDYQPREKIAQSLSCADAHLISLASGMEGLIVPSKFFGILAVARPGLFVGSPQSEIGRILTESGSGITIAPGDGKALAAAIRELASQPEKSRQMGQRGRAALMGKYDASTACRQWVTLLESLVPGAPASAPRQQTSGKPAAGSQAA